MDGKPRIVVVGSFIMDLVVRASRRPARGETLIGTDFGMFPGGKGANQAVAAGRLGGSVCMVGCLGTDSFGDMFLALLEDEGIDTRFVVRDSTEGTGIGNPVIDADGDNSIIIVPRAKWKLSPADVEKAERQLPQRMCWSCSWKCPCQHLSEPLKLRGIIYQGAVEPGARRPAAGLILKSR